MRFVFKRPDYKDLVMVTKEGDTVRVPVVGERLLVPGENIERVVTAVLFRRTLKRGDIVEVNLSNMSGVLISVNNRKGDDSLDALIDDLHIAGIVACGTSSRVHDAKDWKPKKFNADVQTDQVVV